MYPMDRNLTLGVRIEITPSCSDRGRALRGLFWPPLEHWVGAKVHVTRCVDLYSGQILVFSMTLMTVCVLSAV